MIVLVIYIIVTYVLFALFTYLNGRNNLTFDTSVIILASTLWIIVIPILIIAFPFYFIEKKINEKFFNR